MKTHSHVSQKWIKRSFGSTNDFPVAASTPVAPFGKPTGEWFCSLCLKIRPDREPHANCPATARDMDAAITSKTT